MKSKKSLIAFSVVALLAVGVSTGVYAAGVAKKISAYQNPGIKVKVDGNTLDLSDHTGALDPIVYNGHSYVPAKAVAEAMGGAVTWDAANSSVIITTGAANQDNSLPTDGGSSTTPAPTTPAPTTPTTPTTPEPTKPTPTTPTPSPSSNNKGTLNDPIGLGASFTYTDIKNSDYFGNTSAQYTFTVKKAEPISLEAIEALGFKKPEKNAQTEYMMLTVDLIVKNASYLKKGSEYDSEYLSSIEPRIWGVKTAEGNSIIGGTDYGFEGSLDRNISSVLGELSYSKLNVGDSKSYSVSGKILLPVYKNDVNYFILQRSDESIDYDARFIYFKLK